MIPPDAKLLKASTPILSIKNWWCPDCGSHGDDTNVDYVKEGTLPDGSDFVRYCCSECYEQYIYVIVNNDL